MGIAANGAAVAAGVVLGGAITAWGASMARPIVEAEAGHREAEWKTWKSELDREFPTRALPTDADADRLERFLVEHPAPKWIAVDSRDTRHVVVDPFDPISVPKLYQGRLPAFAAVGAATAGSMLLLSSRVTSKLGIPARAAELGAAMLTTATMVGFFGSLFLGHSDTGTKLREHIEATEHQPERPRMR